MRLYIDLKKCICVCMLILTLISVQPKQAQAQNCDSIIALGFASAGFAAGQAVFVHAFEEAFKLAVQVAYETYHALVIDLYIDDLINETWRDHLGTQIWNKDTHGWHDALQFTMAQQHLLIAEQTFARGAFADVRNALATSDEFTQTRADFRDEMTPSESVCVADSLFTPFAHNMITSREVQLGFENDTSGILLNRDGSAASKGRAEFNAGRWSTYVSTFCNHDENNANMPCATALANPNPFADYDISVSDTFFTADTLDLSVAERRAAVTALTQNLTATLPSDLIDKGAYTSNSGPIEVWTKRKKAARYNAVNAAISNVWADRVPYSDSSAIYTDYTAFVEEARQHSKVPAFKITSDNPSKYEIRQAMVEQVLAPQFYVENGDDVATVKRRDVIIQAQQLMMLNDLIDKTEKMAVLFSVQLAEELEK